ncbi:MAG: hypothetical protein H7062_15255, partial [Candidatus Saccharimonas sp.]|nr:hypothetical protein [Planctomycetaceae bacterium]
MTRWTLVAVSCLLLLAASFVAAEDGKLTVVEKAPVGLADKVSAALNPSGQQIAVGGATIGSVWLVKQVEAKADFKPSLSVKYPLTPGQLVGAIEVVKKSEFTDFRGQDVAAGVYTLRYGQQPVDGNHVGTSDLADFLLAIPAKLDTDPALLKMSEAMHKLSAKTSGSNHPAIFSLLPPKPDEKTPALTHDTGKHFWILSLTADGKAGDAAIKVPLRVVIVGV